MITTSASAENIPPDVVRHLDDNSNVATVKDQLPVALSADQPTNKDVGSAAGNASGVVVVGSTTGSSSSVERVATPAIGVCVEPVAVRTGVNNQPDIISSQEETKILERSPVIATIAMPVKCVEPRLAVSKDTSVVKVASPVV